MLQQNRDNNSTNNKERDQKNRIKELEFKSTLAEKELNKFSMAG
jgi:hypothetical protein